VSDPPGILSAQTATLLEREPLVLTARAVAKSLHQGTHNTGGVGGSTEFYDYKQYTAGDSVRFVDWKALGRTDRLYLKRFQHEAQLTVSLVLDASASMRYADPSDESGTTKLVRACELLASLAYLACAQGDRVQLVVSGETTHEQASAGWPVFARVIASLRGVLDETDKGGETLRFCESIAGVELAGDLIVVVSDGLDEIEPLGHAIRGLQIGRAHV